MSLYIDLHVNSGLIAGVAVTRATSNGSQPDSVNSYYWEYRSGDTKLIGRVEHRFGDGAIALAHKVFAAIATTKPNGDNDV